jgi:type I restriction enzyme M protein
MANSASDARNSEADIRQNLIRSGVISCMLTLPKNMFYTVTLPATLWFFDKSGAGKEPTVLFIDARNIFRQVTRALREFTEEHIQNIATIVRLHRGENQRLTELLDKYAATAKAFEQQAAAQKTALDKLQTNKPAFDKDLKAWEKQVAEAEKKHSELIAKQQYFESQIQWLRERFPNGKYEDVTGLCKAATLAEIAEQDWSLNPGRYVGVVIEEDGLTEEEFLAEMKERHAAILAYNKKAVELEKQIAENLMSLY